ncbi:hypothetical protein GCM10022247_06420 [Allokutzneria multivorans]|uniref:Uncharacterized protein n=1 Tax=Allokutzneria multivorans TaxID=1142134 RepID=A0ABP7R1N7_9PSEU
MCRTPPRTPRHALRPRPKYPNDPFSALNSLNDPFGAPKYPKEAFGTSKYLKGPFRALKYPKGPFRAPKYPKGAFGALKYPKGPFGALGCSENYGVGWAGVTMSHAPFETVDMVTPVVSAGPSACAAGRSCRAWPARGR